MLFGRPRDRGELQAWFRVFLGLDLPDGRIDPQSSSSPFELAWEIYTLCSEKSQKPASVIAYACRDGFKTLTAAALEVMVLFLFAREMSHMAAIEFQAAKCGRYVRKFLRRPHLRDFVVGNDKRNIELKWFVSPDGGYHNEAEWKVLPRARRDLCTEFAPYLTVVICSLQGANSEHVPFRVVDEIEVIRDRRAYEEAKLNLAPSQDGGRSVTLQVSSRKFAFGIVQQEIDAAPRTGALVRWWNLVDMAQSCPPERHRPDLPKLQVLVSEEDFRAVPAGAVEDIPPEALGRFKEETAYAGCIENCRLYPGCRGRLARTTRPSSSMHKPIDHIQYQFYEVSLNTALAQLLNRRPTEEGLIYPTFDTQRHMLGVAEAWASAFGDEPRRQVGVADFVRALREAGADFTAGMDHGFAHFFAFVVAALFNQRLFVFAVVGLQGLELHQKIAACRPYRKLRPRIWPDMANPDDNKSFRRARFDVRRWKKKGGTVLSGIERVREIIAPALDEPRVILVREGEGVPALAVQLSQYHWKLGPDGKPTKEPEKINDDLADAFRYMVQNEFRGPQKGFDTEAEAEAAAEMAAVTASMNQTPRQTGWLGEALARAGVDASTELVEEPLPETKRGGRLFFSIE